MTVNEAAKSLGVSRSRVSHMIRDKQLPARRFGDSRILIIEEKDLKRVQNRQPGRPLGKGKKKRGSKKELAGRVWREYQGGKSIEEIAESLGTSYDWARRVVRAHQMIAEGKKPGEIAGKVRTSAGWVKEITTPTPPGT